jgi:hypothetical protein
MSYGIAAVFVHNEDVEKQTFTYYDEYKFKTLEEAVTAINDEYGEVLAQAATLDTKYEEELQGYYFSDLEPYEID